MAATPEQRQAVDVVLEEFFQRTDEGWAHKRCDAEIGRAQEKSQKARESAMLSVAARRKSSDKTCNASKGPEAIDHRPASVRSAFAEQIANERSTECSEGLAPNPNPNPNPKRNTGSGPAQSAAPPPPNFDGRNEEVLNGKSVVPIAAEFELPEQWGIDAEALGWKPGEVLREAEKFRQYWTAGRGKGTRRSVKGWRQSWSTWLSKAAERQR